MDKPLVNRVAASGLITINLEDFFPEVETAVFDIKDYLFMELILKEKDFREALKEHDWSQYTDKVLLVYCSTDAIIPVWAYMLVSSYASTYSRDIFQGDANSYYQLAFQKKLSALDISQYEDQRIVIKGCSDKPVPTSAYVQLTSLLRPLARSIMYGEPCSTVPIFKKKREK